MKWCYIQKWLGRNIAVLKYVLQIAKIYAHFILWSSNKYLYAQQFMHTLHAIGLRLLNCKLYSFCLSSLHLLNYHYTELG